MTDQTMTMTPERVMDELDALLTRAKELALHITEGAARAALSRPAVPEGCKLVPETIPDWGAAPPGATHYQPHQDAYYKRVSASEWYVWSRMNDREPMRWHPSLGTGDNAEWVVRPAEAQPGWYCAHCQRGVDAREVTYSEQHEVCGRYIANDDPPPPSAPAGVRCGECRGTGEVCTGTIDGTPELFDCDRCGGTGNSLAQQPAAAGEEIMVNTPYDVFTLPLQPSGLDGNGPRFVVHVPAPQRESVTVRYDLSPAQTEPAIRDALVRMGWAPPEDESAATVRAERDALRERVKELETDAARYRWLRSRGFGFSHDEAGRGISAERWGEWCLDSKEGFAAQADAAIDAAMQEGKS